MQKLGAEGECGDKVQGGPGWEWGWNEVKVRSRVQGVGREVGAKVEWGWSARWGFGGGVPGGVAVIYVT